MLESCQGRGSFHTASAESGLRENGPNRMPRNETGATAATGNWIPKPLEMSHECWRNFSNHDFRVLSLQSASSAKTSCTSTHFALLMHSIKTGKFLGRIPYAQFGDGRNPILVLNGGQGFMMKPDDARMFKDANRLKHLLPRDRGFVLLGYDPHPSVVSIDGLAAMVAQIVDLHFGGRTDLIGISYGGVVAAAVARQFPAKVERLVLLASAHRFSEDGTRRIERQIQLVEAGNLRALLKEFSAMFRSPILNWLVALRMRIAGPAMSRKFGDPQTIIAHLQAMLESAITGAGLRDVRARSLIIAGSLDQFFGDAIQEAGACIPNARLSVFKGETHMVPIERGNAVKRHLTAFLGEID